MIPPRDYAAQIIAGTGTLEDVPDHLRDIVSSLLEEHEAVVWSRANAIVQLPTRVERRAEIQLLDSSLRIAVERKIIEMWSNRWK